MGNAGIKTGIFLQARLNSRRLHQKALLPLKGGNVVRHAMRALREVKADIHALLTDDMSAPVLGVYAEAEGFEIFTGPSDDVLKRFCMAVRFFKQIEALLPIHAEKRVELSHFVGAPLGTGVEVVEAGALLKVEERSSDFYEREHITTYMYRHPEEFRIMEIPCPRNCALPRARVTLDTASDYDLISRIFQDLYRDSPIETEEIVLWLKHCSNESSG
ncbi:hypothetical protein ES705_47524 [subsurface metagenome]